ncbi:MAG: NTP transferase domain-containing protein [Solobacterium sp.]|nr:NTP transferase domain-containing protein [Solobacterium sp.]MBQ1354969.1 NTP transferase domain-containing protein [Solobacterium sp.]
MKNAIVLAAGKGTRMHSDVPKVLHKVCGMPMAEVIVKVLKQAGTDRIVAVTGFGHALVEEALAGQCEFALQEPQLGTGHAVMQARQLAGEDGLTLVVNGDAPCLKPETLNRLYDALADADMAVLTVSLEQPGAYGRIVRRADGSLEKIVEFKDCTEEEKAIREVNAGFYAFRNRTLFDHLGELTDNNAQKEYYITDMVQILLGHGLRVAAVESDDPDEVRGVNDNAELAKAEKILQRRINTAWMKKGVTITDPETAYIGPDVIIGKDVTIGPGVTLYGKTSVGDRTVIMPGCQLTDTAVGADCTVNTSVICGRTLADKTIIQPYTYLRNQ